MSDKGFVLRSQLGAWRTQADLDNDDVMQLAGPVIAAGKTCRMTRRMPQTEWEVKATGVKRSKADHGGIELRSRGAAV